MADIISIRDELDHDARAWTPLDALKFLVERIESGEREAPAMIYIAMQSKPKVNNDGVLATYLDHTCAGCTNTEAIGLLMQHIMKSSKEGI